MYCEQSLTNVSPAELPVILLRGYFLNYCMDTNQKSQIGFKCATKSAEEKNINMRQDNH